jgi:uncharacterized protein
MMSEVQLRQILTYPIKSCGVLSHEHIELDRRGPVGDRRWMVIDHDDKFLTQRELSSLALIQPTFEGDCLRINAPGMPAVYVPLRHERPQKRSVQVWRDVCEGWDEGDDLARWLTEYLKVEARLVYMADDFTRVVNENYARQPAETGFADGFPLLIAAEESLAELNRRMVERGKPAIPMSRFRPNLVLAGGEAFAEDTWRTVRIGDMTIDVVKPCARCATTTVDQASGAIPDTSEPLGTLATFRKQNGKVMFSQNAVHHAPGRLAVGDKLEILEGATHAP